MHRRTTLKVFAYSRELRHNTTPAEQKLWTALRVSQPEGVHFRRQHAIGNYIVDFCASRQKLIIELDGGQHLEQEAYVQERTEFLQSKGYRVLRFWNNDVTNDLDNVIQVILEALNISDSTAINRKTKGIYHDCVFLKSCQTIFPTP